MLLFLAAFTTLHASEHDKQCETRPPEGEAGILAESKQAVTHHTLKTLAGSINYRATAGSLTVHEKQAEAVGRIFYIAYTTEHSATNRRPLTFVFNGGPGAASAYLHLGALGPQRIVINDDGTVPASSARLKGNALSWLDFTDLVFVDPIGTGYSRTIPVPNGKNRGKPESAEGASHHAPPWGVAEDTHSLAIFIRLYLTRQERWLSPIYLAGESYGGFRVAWLSTLLQTEFGINPAGLIMISPALDFGLLWGGDQELLSWAALLPSYAAVAATHKRIEAVPQTNSDPRTRLADVEEFALSGLLVGLVGGDRAHKALRRRLGELTGLNDDMLQRYRSRVPPARFAKALLADRRRVVSLYDGSISLIDPDPTSPVLTNTDPYLVRINATLTPAFNSYIRERLSFKTDLRYQLLNKEVSKSWNWRSGIAGRQGYADVNERLIKTMSLNPDLQVLIMHGVYDLVTPYFGSVIAVEQMALEPSMRKNIQVKVYEGGHMLYFHRLAREQMYRDVQRFFAR